MLKVDIKSKRFVAKDGAQLPVLSDLAFECGDRSFTCIVGPSGCGKTTTLRCILGLDTDFDGAITMAGGSGRQKLSAVFQEPRLLPWRSVEQNVRLALNEVDEQTLDALFEELGLTAHRSFFPTELSLGLARRVSLARAFAVNPSVLILDEPFVSLDESTAVRLRSLLLKVWSARSCTALMVTHNLSEAAVLADRILFLNGAPATVQHEYLIAEPREERDAKTVTSILDDINTNVYGVVTSHHQ